MGREIEQYEPVLGDLVGTTPTPAAEQIEERVYQADYPDGTREVGVERIHTVHYD